ncbi:MAG TPA: hypothetical protein VG248_15045 [Caulobacteraceae bacterium]|jgi:hypothetical protein|nr:hypothetical protein [Caulobacteraceae bacterium]
MSLLERIPTLDEVALKNLLENARRLEATGTERQKADAAELLPVLEATFAERESARLEAAAEKRAATRRTTAERKAKAAAV